MKKVNVSIATALLVCLLSSESSAGEIQFPVASLTNSCVTTASDVVTIEEGSLITEVSLNIINFALSFI